MPKKFNILSNILGGSFFSSFSFSSTSFSSFSSSLDSLSLAFCLKDATRCCLILSDIEDISEFIDDWIFSREDLILLSSFKIDSKGDDTLLESSVSSLFFKVFKEVIPDSGLFIIEEGFLSDSRFPLYFTNPSCDFPKSLSLDIFFFLDPNSLDLAAPRAFCLILFLIAPLAV